MTIRYNIEPDREALEEVVQLFKFIGGNSRRAQVRGINQTIPKVRAMAAREIKTQINVTQQVAKDQLDYIRATQSFLQGKIKTKRRGLLSARYDIIKGVASNRIAPQRPDSISVQIKPKGAARRFRGRDIEGSPFYMVLPKTEKRTVAIVGRRTTPGPRGGKIRVFYSPSVPQVWTDVKDKILPQAAEIYTEQLAEAIRYLLFGKLPPDD